MNLATLVDYKRWANAELLDVAAEAESGMPADDFRAVLRILNHTLVVDRIFAGHLRGEAHGFTSTNTDATPTLATLRAAMAESDVWYADYVRTVPAERMQGRLPFAFTDGERGSMRRGEMLHHVVVHGTYHRGAAGRILFAHGATLPRDAITTFLHRMEPARRGA